MDDERKKGAGGLPEIASVIAFGVVAGASLAAFELLLGVSPGLRGPVVALISAAATAAVCAQLLARRHREYIAVLKETATTDPLTKLLNRRGFQRRFEIELARMRRSGMPLVLAVADLDDFKRVNDGLGHLGGDMALERVAGVLRRDERIANATGRLGGDEFAIVLPDTSPFEALAATEHLRGEIERSFHGTAAHLTASFGLAVYPEDGTTLEELLDAADRAAYRAKALGKNRSVAHGRESVEATEPVRAG